MNVSVVDLKGRILISAKTREQYRICPKDIVKFEIKEVVPRKSFAKECTGTLKDKKSAMELIRAESVFR